MVHQSSKPTLLKSQPPTMSPMTTTSKKSSPTWTYLMSMQLRRRNGMRKHRNFWSLPKRVSPPPLLQLLRARLLRARLPQAQLLLEKLPQAHPLPPQQIHLPPLQPHTLCHSIATSLMPKTNDSQLSSTHGSLTASFPLLPPPTSSLPVLPSARSLSSDLELVVLHCH